MVEQKAVDLNLSVVCVMAVNMLNEAKAILLNHMINFVYFMNGMECYVNFEGSLAIQFVSFS